MIGDGQGIIPAVSFADYGERATSELSKYEIVNTQVATLNPYGFLSPMSLNMTPNPVEVSTNNSTVTNDSVLPIVSA